ncbi:MAG: hypothetical protein QMD95_04825 [Candidatus Hodarchaeaceae archaeon]|nr:hypothetical protein [Candidatus Hodarchaeaceae archaeon]
MTDEENQELIEKRCERCGLRGYYVENGLCLDCMEAELRKNADLVLPALNGNNHLRGRLHGG